ncbi:MAG: hypothetical protein ACRCUM_03855 [Mycoplasmoidaceae bacterium]
MKRYKLGIDLATLDTGIILASIEDNTWKVLYRKTMKLEPFCQVNMKDNVLKIKQTFEAFKAIPNLEVYIELGNFGNANMTGKFSTYIGVILNDFPQAMIFFPNNWQKFLGQDEKGFHTLKREELKALSRRKVETVFGSSQDWSEDECDAFAMVYFSDIVKTCAYGKVVSEDYKKRIQRRRK